MSTNMIYLNLKAEIPLSDRLLEKVMEAESGIFTPRFRYLNLWFDVSINESWYKIPERTTAAHIVFRESQSFWGYLPLSATWYKSP